MEVIMSAYPDIRVNGNSLDRTDGTVWYRLHSEREDICEALNRESRAGHEDRPGGVGLSKEEASRAENWHLELMQSRLRKIDDALDRLMAGSYGNCSKCGRWIEDTKLDFDPAIAFCINCWETRAIH
jgi:RNA polymerase-binding transcription factor DksA